MNKLTFALIIALSSGYTVASDVTAYGGDLDGNFEEINIDTMSTTVRNSDPVNLIEAYSGLDGDVDEHFFSSGAPSNVRPEMVNPTKAYVDLDGNSDLFGGV